MAGKRQHFIPRFLQEGFVSHRNASNTFTWLYREKISPVNTNIINVGSEGYFYNDNGDNTVDDLITDKEAEKFSPLINSLRDGVNASWIAKVKFQKSKKSQPMTKNTAKEFYAAKNNSGGGLSVMFVLEDNKEIRLKVSRDIATAMIEKLYIALDTKGLLHKSKDVR